MRFCLPRDIAFPSRRGCTVSGQTELRAGGRGDEDGNKNVYGNKRRMGKEIKVKEKKVYL